MQRRDRVAPARAGEQSWDLATIEAAALLRTTALNSAKLHDGLRHAGFRSKLRLNWSYIRDVMLRLSKKTDYALMAMKHLASDPRRRAASAREIAETYDIPVELMSKVLTRLVRSGLLISHQGVHGGYELAQPPAATSLAAVLEAIDGPLTMTACTHGDDRCDQFSKCNVRDPLRRVKDRIAAILAQCSISEMTDDPDPSARPVTVIPSPAMRHMSAL
jgi:Rrf2 family protein